MSRHTKLRMGARGLGFWYDTDFKKNVKSRCHTKRRMVRTYPSFGMTTAQDIRNLFAKLPQI